MFELNKKTVRNIFVVVAAGIVLYWILHETERVKSVYAVVKSIFSPFVFGAGIAFILRYSQKSGKREVAPCDCRSFNIYCGIVGLDFGLFVADSAIGGYGSIAGSQFD